MNYCYLRLVVGFVLLQFIPHEALFAQDPFMDNPRLNPQLMKRGVKGTLPSVFKSSRKAAGVSGVGDWKAWIDTTWADNLTTAEKLSIFDAFWNIADQQYGGFPNLNIDWDSLRDHYRPIVESGVSRGRFYGIMSHLSNALQEVHAWVTENEIDGQFYYPGGWYFWPTEKVPLAIWGGWGNSTAGMGVVPMPDKSLFVLRAQPGNPLGMQAGDIVLGYDGMKWKDILRLIDSVEVPITGDFSFQGSSTEAYEYSRLNAAPLNWFMFDTVDVVRYATGDTLHLSTQPLADAPMFWDSLYNLDAIPVPGVPMPDPYQNRYTSWGIIEGTSIGYIYIQNWATDQTAYFTQAVNELMHTTSGLIIDVRLNYGGLTATALGGLSALFNEDISMNYEFAQRSSTSDHFGFKHIPSTPLVPTPDIYDHPIALLTGPGCLSAGDMNAFKLRFHPMVRTFGKRTNTAFIYGNERAPLVRAPWEYRMSFGSWFSFVKDEGFLIHKGFPVDEEIWHNREDAAHGVDAVVKRAVEWINNASYAYGVHGDKLFYYQNLDTVRVFTNVANPNSHSLRVTAYYCINGAVIDSSEFSDQGGYYETSWVPTGGDFEVMVVTHDRVDHSTFRLKHLVPFTVSGPSLSHLALEYGVIDTGQTKTDSVQIRNTTSDVLHIESVTLDFPSHYSVSPSAATLGLGDSATFVVTFHPTAHGMYNGKLTFNHDEASSPAVVTLKGVCSPPSIDVAVEAKWNLISVPMRVASYLKDTLFPGASSKAFLYRKQYREADTLKPGLGYWLKYPSGRTLTIKGIITQADSFDVEPGWNIVGSISSAVPASSLGSNPPAIVISPFFSYSSELGYRQTDTIKPGHGYWVKANQTGQLILTSSGTIPSANRVRILVSSETPPSPPESEIAHPKSPVPSDFSLSQNYPNPFNPKTDFRLQIADDGFVSLKIYDVLGREVATLVDKEMEPGEYTVSWNADGFPSGIYVCRMKARQIDGGQAGTFVETRKLLIVR